VLRSLNSLITRLWPVPPETVSLGINGDRLVVVRAKRTATGYHISHLAQERLPFTPFMGTNPRAEDSTNLTRAIQKLAIAIPQWHLPLQIALPDPAGIFRVMKFDSLPATDRERAAITRFRLEKEWSAVAEMECTTQVLGEGSNPNFVLALAIQRSWLDCLRNACRSAGWVPNVIDIAVNHLFNRIHDLIIETKGDGALISIEADSWSIIFWDQTHRPRFVRSLWRDSCDRSNADYEMIAKDVERLVRAYVHAEIGRNIEKVYLSVAEEESAEFSRWLDARMRVPCEYFNVTKEFTVDTTVSIRDIAPGVLAAAVPRL